MVKLGDEWWRKAVFYAIWPRSFKDGNGDGIGDIPGIISKLDYLQSLGVNGLWISPIFVSPKKDQGYDVSDYCKISPEFGTMKDVEEMVQEAHKRDIKIIFDLVCNHSSYEHPWFIKSQAGDPKYKDYYIWRKGKGVDGLEPPNNWGSIFGGSTWTYSPSREEFYFHMFSAEQPDLNLVNPLVQAELEEITNFWTAKGIDGYRLDAAAHFAKPADFPDYPTTEKNVIGNMHFNNPGMHELEQMMNTIIKKPNPDSMILSEIAGIEAKEFDLSCAPERHEADMVIVFEHMMIDTDYDKFMGKFKTIPFDLLKLKTIFKSWYQEMKRGWLALYLGNLDQPRILSRWGDEGVFRIQSGKMLGTFYHTLRGTPFIYQGEEIGMTNWRFKVHEADDIEFKGFYQKLVVDMKLLTEEEYMKLAHQRARDTARTPVHWTSSKHGGFTDGDETWIGMCTNYDEINVEDSIKEPNSIWNHYRKLCLLRKSEELIVHGNVRMAFEENTEVMSYFREMEETPAKLLVICNFFKVKVQINLEDEMPKGEFGKWRVLLSNYEDVCLETSILKLRPYEAIVFKIDN